MSETDEDDSTKEVILVVEDNFDMRGYIKGKPGTELQSY